MGGKRVYVVDDEPLMRDTMAAVLRRRHIEVTTADGISAFRQAFRLEDAGLVVMDLNLGDEDGLDGIEALLGFGYEGPLIFVSGVDERTLAKVESFARAKGLNVLGSLGKPFSASELATRAATLLARGDNGLETFRGGLRAGQVVPYYQAIVDLRDGSLVGAEALARWLNAAGEVVAPSVFVPLAESHGLIDELTVAMLNRAAADCAVWRRRTGRDLKVSVNVSASSLRDKGLLDALGSALREARLPADGLEIEVTESVAMGDVDRIMEILARISIKGVRVALDDFGTGFSSLVALMRMPFAKVKIDQSFVRLMTVDREARCIVEAILGMAKGLHLDAVAEGIEDAETLEALRGMGCRYAQGFHIARPMPGLDFEAFLQALPA